MKQLHALAGAKGYKGGGTYVLALSDFIECFVEVQQPGLRLKVQDLLKSTTVEETNSVEVAKSGLCPKVQDSLKSTVDKEKTSEEVATSNAVMRATETAAAVSLNLVSQASR